MIAECFNFQSREQVVYGFDFLKAGDIGLAFLQPMQQIFDTCFDTVNIPRSNFQSRIPVLIWYKKAAAVQIMRQL
jgi:hypothetical protein